MSSYDRISVLWFSRSRSSLLWRHNDHDSVSNHQPHDCLLSRLFRHRSKKTSKLRVTGLCVGNSPGPVNSPHKGPVTRKMFPFDDVIMGSNKLLHIEGFVQNRRNSSALAMKLRFFCTKSSVSTQWMCCTVYVKQRCHGLVQQYLVLFQPISLLSFPDNLWIFYEYWDIPHFCSIDIHIICRSYFEDFEVMRHIRCGPCGCSMECVVNIVEIIDWVNSLRSSDAIWRHNSESTLAR